MISQKIIPAIASIREFEKFLVSKEEYCILLDFHLGFVGEMVKQAHKVRKKVLLHIDLTKGISSDEYGCEYACQKLFVDGIVTTKVKAIETAKKNKKIAIFRLFLIDTTSLEKGIKLCNTVYPDYIEVLPGIATSAIPMIQKEISSKIMCGGLIHSMEQVEECIRAGATAVTISSWYTKKEKGDFKEGIAKEDSIR